MILELIMEKMIFMVLVIFCALHPGLSTTHVVKSDYGDYSNQNGHTLDYYLMKANEYFRSHARLYFSSGNYHLNNDLILKDIQNFTFCGNFSVIWCDRLSVTVAAVNVTNLTISNIAIRNCGRKDNRTLKDDHPSNHTGIIYLYHCNTVVISSILLTGNPDVSRIVAVNVFAANFIDVKITTGCKYPNNISSLVNGMEFYFEDFHSKTHVHQHFTHYIYDNNGLCDSSYALLIILIQESYGMLMVVRDMSFSHLYNSSVLYYHGESCGDFIGNHLSFINCNISNNSGSPSVNLFDVFIYRGGSFHGRNQNQSACYKQFNAIKVVNLYTILT